MNDKGLNGGQVDNCVPGVSCCSQKQRVPGRSGPTRPQLAKPAEVGASVHWKA